MIPSYVVTSAPDALPTWFRAVCVIATAVIVTAAVALLFPSIRKGLRPRVRGTRSRDRRR